MPSKPGSRSSTQHSASQGRGKGKVTLSIVDQPTVKPTGNKTKRAGLQFPVTRIHRRLKVATEKPRVSFGSAVYTASVLEYLVAEMVELAGNACRDVSKVRITPCHLQLAVRNDDELNHLLKDVVIVEGGVLPHIAPELLKKTGTTNKVKVKHSQEV
ncbi:hypothetical protein E1B28_007325 [Marasmius oreades]|uniref:Histone H2A n=1 Tax=Marasmius oreades TaxID=181124 RepID=A0A9P7S2S2_9AGAR|nr:uncharacterized protein E1B28_007325 [Marasmius oreades]KAG7093666.1 hypothetical protein E1B28_007325 [Marasmius oreades]